ncbi:hypothetical protein ACQEVB_27630 [Pseudonocardia sp. CA-107938]|uniref:hypothetical protein n=1 Tax=Pseudonocardia sp. CA-107938 TaxID=3240021 RepID=UPI003D93D1C3
MISSTAPVPSATGGGRATVRTADSATTTATPTTVAGPTGSPTRTTGELAQAPATTATIAPAVHRTRRSDTGSHRRSPAFAPHPAEPGRHRHRWRELQRRRADE